MACGLLYAIPALAHERRQLPIEYGYLFAFLAYDQATCITGHSVAFHGAFAL